MVQIQFSLSDEVIMALRATAAKKGITPNILARLILHEHFSCPDAESKSYTFTARNWRELETYAEAKRLGSVEILAAFAMEQYMNRNQLTEAQKRQVEKSIGNA